MVTFNSELIVTTRGQDFKSFKWQFQIISAVQLEGSHDLLVRVRRYHSLGLSHPIFSGKRLQSAIENGEQSK